MPVLRIAPDGRHALVMAAVRQYTALGTSTSTPHAWIVDLDGAVTGVRVRRGRRRQSVSRCLSVGRLRDAGHRGAGLPGVGSSTRPSRSRSTGAALTGAIWAPSGCRHASSVVTAAARRDQGHRLPLGPDRPPPLGRRSGDRWRAKQRHARRPREPCRRHRARRSPAARHGPRPGPMADPGPTGRPERTLVGSPDGQLLFAIGRGPEPDSSSGVWVFDARTLELLERWPAKAAYQSLAAARRWPLPGRHRQPGRGRVRWTSALGDLDDGP